MENGGSAVDSESPAATSGAEVTTGSTDDSVVVGDVTTKAVDDLQPTSDAITCTKQLQQQQQELTSECDNATDGVDLAAMDAKQTSASVAEGAHENVLNGVVNGGDDVIADQVTQDGVDGHSVEDSNGFHVEERHEIEQSNRTEQVSERPDGSEELRLQESHRLQLEEVASREAELRPATEEELQALEMQQRSECGSGDDVVEIPIGKDVIVEEFKRVESIHEEKVAGEVVHAVETVTEEHSTEQVSEETQLPQQPEQPETAANGVENGAEETTAVADEPEKQPEASEPVADVESPPAAAAASEAETTEDPTAAAAAAENLVTSPSTDDVVTKEKSSKGKGLIGFLKARTRSQSREREEQKAKEEQKTKKEEAQQKSRSLERSQKKSDSLERDQKKFKLNIFGKKSDDEKEESADVAADKEATKPKSSKKGLFGKKSKEKSADDVHEKAADDKEHQESGEEHGQKTKERKWFNFGKKPAKETPQAAVAAAQPVEAAVLDEPADAQTGEQVDSVDDSSKPVEQLGESKVEEAETQPAGTEEIADGTEKQDEAEKPEEATESAEDGQGVVSEEQVAEETGDVKPADVVSDEEKPSNSVVESKEPEPEESKEEVEVTATSEESKDAVEEQLPESAAEAVKDDNHVTEDSEKALETEPNNETAGDVEEPADESGSKKEVSPGGTLNKEPEVEEVDSSKEPKSKKFSFGFKFGKKQKDQPGKGDASDDHKIGEEAGKDSDQTNQAHDVKPDEEPDAKQGQDDGAKQKQSKMKLFSFGKKSKSKQKDEGSEPVKEEPEPVKEEPEPVKQEPEQIPTDQNDEVPAVEDTPRESAEQTEENVEQVPEKETEPDANEILADQPEPSTETKDAETSEQAEAVESAPENAVVEDNGKEQIESVDDASVTQKPDSDSKTEPKEQKKSLFGIKFGLKHEHKEEDAHTDDSQKTKEKWSPFGKKFGKKSTSEHEKVEGEAGKVEPEPKLDAAEDTKPLEEGTEEVAKSAETEEATESNEPHEDVSKPVESKEKTVHVRLPKLFSFEKKKKAAEEKPGENGGKNEDEAPEAAAKPDEGDDAVKQPEEQVPEEKKIEETEPDKKEDSKITTGIKKLFTLGRKTKETSEDKPESAAAETGKAEDVADETTVAAAASEASPEVKVKQAGKAQREKSPHRKFPFDIKFGKKKEKEEKQPDVVAETVADAQAATAEVVADAAEADSAPVEHVKEQQTVVDDADELTVEITEAVTVPQQEASPKLTSDEEPVPIDLSLLAESQPEAEAVVITEGVDSTEPQADQEKVIEEENVAVTESAVAVEPEVPVEQSATESDAPVVSASAEDETKPEVELEPTPTAAVEPAPSGDKETKGRRRFPFGLKFGKRAERARSAERDVTPKNKATEVAEKAEVLKPVETSASVPDVRLHATSSPDPEAEGGEKEVETATETTPAKSKHELPHLNIKWPHFGKKKTENGEQPEAAGTTGTNPEPASDKDATPKKQHSAGTSATDFTKKSSLGKGIFKLFSPRRDLHKSASCSAGDDKEPFVSYSVEGQGQIVAETHWRAKSATLPAGEEHRAARLSKSPTCIEQSRQDEPLVDVVADTADHRPGADGATVPGSHLVVVAIDFGTTYSGYAFSFARDWCKAASGQSGIHMMRRWEGGDPGVVNQKTPTTILLTPNGEFHSFGFTARDFFHDLDPTEASRWMYFEKFKMDLHHSTELNSETTIRSSNGHEFPALKLFALALRYFKEHALKELSSQSATIIVNEDVRWVITVPAIWKAPAKQFMREAAYEAGIASTECPDNLLIALEPEAASIYIRQLRLSQLVPDRSLVISRNLALHKDTTATTTLNGTTSHDASEVELNGDVSITSSRKEQDDQDRSIADEFHTGTRYMVVDCGGGTVDITVHEIENDSGNLKELFKATGGPYGSTGVDREFEKLLSDIFGVEFIESFKSKRPAGWVDLMIAFESRKRAANPHKTNALNVSLPFSFIDFHKKHFNAQVESAIKKYGDKDIHWSMQGMLRLMPDAMKRLFQPTLDSIKNAISQVISHDDVTGLEYLFLVGGFAESPILQFEIRREFEHLMKIVIPQEVSLTILKGAVCFGLDPTVVTVRKSRLSYGVGVLNRFQPDVHPESKLVRRGGSGTSDVIETDWCRDVFDMFVRADQSIALGDTVMRRYTPAERGQTTIIIRIYSAETNDVRFITDDGVQQCGTLRLELTTDADAVEVPAGRRREIQTRMTFGDTEIKVWALDVATGRSVRAAIDFLNK